MTEEGFIIPILSMFYNDASSVEILKRKWDRRKQSVMFDQEMHLLKNSRLYSRFVGYISLFFRRFAHSVAMWRYQPNSEVVERCLESPEFQILVYVHKLTQRMAAWRSFPNKHTPFEDLPAEFRFVKGPSDPSHAEYKHLVRVEEMVNAYIPQELQKTMFITMLAEKFNHARTLEPLHRQ